MTVPNETSFTGPLIANGITTAFPFTFLAMGEDEIDVFGLDPAGSEASLPDFTIALAGAAPASGTVTFDTPPGDGLRIWIASAPDFRQEIAFEDGSRWLAGPVNEANDRAAIRALALKRDADRAVKLPIGEAGVTLPAGSGPVLYASVNRLAGIAGDIEAVADRAADVATVANRDADIGLVAARDAAIAVVAARDADIGAVAVRDADIGTVAAIATDVIAVSADSVSIGAVASNIASLNTCAENIAEITAVPSTVASLGATADLLPALADAADQAAPGSRVTYGKPTLGTLSNTNMGTWHFTDANQLAAAGGWLNSARVWFNTALVGRTVHLYILNPANSLVVSVLGPYSVEAQGWNAIAILEYTTANAVTAGYAIGIVCSHVSANGIGFETTTGLTTLRSTSITPLATGANYTIGMTSQTNFLPRVVWTLTPSALFLTIDSIDVANGVPGLDSTARIQSASLPKWLSAGDTLTSSNTTATDERRTALSRVRKVRRKTALTTLTQWARDADADGDGGSYTNLTTAQQFVRASYLSTAPRPGLAGGYLQRIKLPPNITVGAGGGKIQGWLMRPRTSIVGVGDGVSIGCDWVADLFEYDVPDGIWASDLFIEISLPKVLAQAGDLVFVRGVNVGMPIGTAHTSYAADMLLSANLTDLTMAAVHDGLVATTNDGNRVPMMVETAEHPLASEGDGKNSLLALDKEGNIPKHIGRTIDLPWQGKCVIITGTSLEAGEATDSPGPRQNHAWKLLDALQPLRGHNVAWGGSSITPLTSISLGHTIAEKTASYPGYEGYSYENLLISKITSYIAEGGSSKDVLWIDFHVINDFYLGGALGANVNETNVTTFYGIYNRVVPAFLSATSHKGRMLFVGPQNWIFNGATHAQLENFRSAKRLIAEKWGAKFVDLTYEIGLNMASHATLNPDGVHSIQVIRDNIFRRVYAEARKA